MTPGEELAYGAACAIRGKLRQPEVQNLHLSRARHEDVGRLDVAVDDALGVCGVEAFGDLHRDIQQALQIEALPRDPVLQCLALEDLHDDERAAGVLVDLVNGADVPVIQGRCCPRLAVEAFERLRIGGGAVGQELDGDVPAQPQVFGPIDDAHSAGAELRRHAIVRDCLADHGGGPTEGYTSTARNISAPAPDCGARSRRSSPSRRTPRA